MGAAISRWGRARKIFTFFFLNFDRGPGLSDVGTPRLDGSRDLAVSGGGGGGREKIFFFFGILTAVGDSPTSEPRDSMGAAISRFRVETLRRRNPATRWEPRSRGFGWRWGRARKIFTFFFLNFDRGRRLSDVGTPRLDGSRDLAVSGGGGGGREKIFFFFGILTAVGDSPTSEPRDSMGAAISRLSDVGTPRLDGSRDLAVSDGGGGGREKFLLFFFGILTAVGDSPTSEPRDSMGAAISRFRVEVGEGAKNFYFFFFEF
ncbi:hypothetical protein Phum_PHUM591020 [Pediculus humanus corporis]|uniref:Uncharacterized protein n=1 Tax=Pediculus humanus subsp. corporis TaxID=121224 RepID=E0W2F0_PEDHC|nr:uncharacterized protein Phum_PHUM591020 [Pediculus humanus corporis]EEB19806.1 hypothetical protein Phum_PHUM591020 [Pediculus humanus corporis]